MIFLAAQLFYILPLGAAVLPGHPKISQSAEQSMLVNGVNIRTAQYSSVLSADAILDFYRNNLLAEGWKIEFETLQNGVYLMVFSNDKKETLGIDVYPKEAKQGCDITGTYTWGATEPPSPDKDVAGRDLPWLNRYPGSLRYTDMEWDRGKTLVYVNQQADFLEVADFYREQLIASGWQLQKESVLSKQNLLDMHERLPDNIKSQMQGMEEESMKIEKEAISMFLKGKNLLLVSVAQVSGQVAATVNYIINYQKEM